MSDSCCMEGNLFTVGPMEIKFSLVFINSMLKPPCNHSQQRINYATLLFIHFIFNDTMVDQP